MVLFIIVAKPMRDTNNFWAQVHINEMNCRFYVRSVQIMWCNVVGPGLCLRLYGKTLGLFLLWHLYFIVQHLPFFGVVFEQHTEFYAGFEWWNEWMHTYKRTNCLCVCVNTFCLIARMKTWTTFQCTLCTWKFAWNANSYKSLTRLLDLEMFYADRSR